MIIGLCGYKGTGKTTVADHLVKEYGFKRVNFKDGLIAELCKNMPLVIQELMTLHNMTVQDLFNIKPPIMRALMQNYGTEVRRGDNPDYWVERWKELVSETVGNIVTDDVRFFNELAAVGDKNGVLIRVTRDDITTGGEHLSEKEQEKFIEDFIIVGQPGSHNQVYKQVDDIITTIKNNND